MAVHHGGGVGGAPVSLLKLLAGLDPQEFSAQAVFTEPGDVLTYAHDLGVPARIVPTGGAFFYSAHARLGVRSMARFVRTFPSAVRTAQHALHRQRPDLLHLNTSVLLAWAVAARRERIPVVWVVREVLGSNPWLRNWHSHFIQKHARTIVAISNAVRECFPQQARVQRVYNAVDLAEFSIVENQEAARAELGIGPNRQVLMAIGSVQRVKGHWLLLDALGRPEVANADLVLVTGGVAPEYAHSTNGRIKRSLKMPLDNLDALKRDAQRRGLSDRIHVTGFRRDVARVLYALGELLRAPEERARMGQAGRRRVEACFTLDRQVAEMSAIYREAASSA